MRDHAHSAALTWRAGLETWKLKRRKKAMGKALLVAYREIGDTASDKSEAKERRSFGSVKERERALADLEAALAERERVEGDLRQALADRTAVRTAEIDALSTELRELTAASDAAEGARRRCAQEIAALEKSIARPEEKRKGQPPLEEQRAALAERQAELPGLASAADGAREARERKQSEFKSERKAWREESDRREDEIRAAAREVQRTRAEINEAQIGLDGSLEDLGKSVYLAGLASSDLEGPMARAKEHLKTIEECQRGILERKLVIAEHRPAAVRFAAVTGGSLLVLVIAAAVLLGSGSDRGTTKIEPATSTAKSGPVPTKNAADPALRDAVLALPPLAERERDGVVVFRPTGEVNVGRREATPDGGSRLPIIAGAESRADPDGEFERITIHLLLVLDRDGQITKWLPDGLGDLSEEDQAGLLGGWK